MQEKKETTRKNTLFCHVVSKWNPRINLKTEKNNLELDLEEERTLKDLQVRKIEEIQSEYNELSRELAQMEERLVNLCKGQETKEKIMDLFQKKPSSFYTLTL